MKRTAIGAIRSALAIGLLASAAAIWAVPLTAPCYETYTAKQAEGFNRQAKTALAPVYPYLAEYLVTEFKLAAAPGIGIDLGSGPGDLVIELAKRTQSIYWIDADINPHYFRYFYEAAGKAGLSHRVGAVFADAQSLPFRDNYADIIVSRGSFQFWPDKKAAFGEIVRVLKPGAVAFIGRGFPETMPLEEARAVRAGQGKGPPAYDIEKTKALLTATMTALGVTQYEFITPKKADPSVRYGIWLKIVKANK